MSLTVAMFYVIAMVYPLGWLATAFDGNKNRNLSKTTDVKAKVLLLIIFIIIFIFAGYRHISGLTNNDEMVYRERITFYYKYTFVEILQKIEIFSALPTWIMSKLSQNTQNIILYNSFVTYFLFCYSIKKQCDNYELGILLLFLLNIVNYSFNVMQQVEASAILMLAIPYAYKKDFKKYLIIVIMATLVHTSSIVMIIFYFMLHMKPWSVKFFSVSFAFILLMAVFNRIAAPLMSSMGIYDNYISTLESGGGVKLITVIVAFIPILMAFAFKKYIPEDDKEFSCLINASMIYAMIYLVASQQIYVARFAIFFLPWLIPFYTKLVTVLRKERLSFILYYVLVIGYGATTIYFTSSADYSLML